MAGAVHGYRLAQRGADGVPCSTMIQFRGRTFGTLKQYVHDPDSMAVVAADGDVRLVPVASGAAANLC